MNWGENKNKEGSDPASSGQDRTTQDDFFEIEGDKS